MEFREEPMKAYLIDRLQFLAVGVLAVLIGMVVAVTSFAWFPSQAPKKGIYETGVKAPGNCSGDRN